MLSVWALLTNAQGCQQSWTTWSLLIGRQRTPHPFQGHSFPLLENLCSLSIPRMFRTWWLFRICFTSFLKSLSPWCRHQKQQGCKSPPVTVDMPCPVWLWGTLLLTLCVFQDISSRWSSSTGDWGETRADLCRDREVCSLWLVLTQKLMWVPGRLPSGDAPCSSPKAARLCLHSRCSREESYGWKCHTLFSSNFVFIFLTHGIHFTTLVCAWLCCNLLERTGHLLGTICLKDSDSPSPSSHQSPISPQLRNRAPYFPPPFRDVAWLDAVQVSYRQTRHSHVHMWSCPLVSHSSSTACGQCGLLICGDPWALGQELWYRDAI